MSICSDVFITKEKARAMVKRVLLSQQEILIDQAIKGMDTWELRRYLNSDGSIYYYNIERSDDEEREE